MWNTGLTSVVSCLLVLSTSFAWGQTGQKKIIHDAEYYVLEAQNGERWAAEDRQIDESEIDEFGDLAWSPDGAWLAYVAYADNRFRHIRIYGVAQQRVIHATTDRFDSYSPRFSADRADWQPERGQHDSLQLSYGTTGKDSQLSWNHR